MKSGLLMHFLLALILCTARSQAQTLFTYGSHDVSKEEFLRAFQKNNSNVRPTGQAYRDYLDLYVKYKLKVQAAHDMKLDTIPAIIAEVQNYRSQIADPYLRDESYIDRLVDEAFVRSQKDIHTGAIFINMPPTPADTTAAWQKVSDAVDALKKGAPFSQVAEKFSEDPFVKTNHGDLGYITVFSLPYALENQLYQTPSGRVAVPLRTKAGYVIFKNMGERKAAGHLRLAQILLAYPYNADEQAKIRTGKTADSVYRLLTHGADFADLAKKVSGDNSSYLSGGELPEVGIGKYDPAFESAAYALTRDGELSKPVQTAYGYHIIKRIAARPVSAERNKATLDGLRQRVLNDSRMEVARKAMNQKVLELVHFKENTISPAQFSEYTDAALQGKPLPVAPNLYDGTVLFTVGKKSVTMKDWINYRQTVKNTYQLTHDKTNRTLLDEFEQATAFDYYRDHLEDFNTDFAYQLNEFREGNLLFEAMQRKVWDKAAADTTGLEKYYEAHRNNYWWEPSADVLLFTFNSNKDESMIRATAPHAWRKLADSSNGSIQIDSGRFELSQLPPAERGPLQDGTFSSITKSQTSTSLMMAYIIHVYPQKQLRGYADARGLVMNDYQNKLENDWVADLKQAYPITVNETVFKSLPK